MFNIFKNKKNIYPTFASCIMIIFLILTCIFSFIIKNTKTESYEYYSSSENTYEFKNKIDSLFLKLRDLYKNKNLSVSSDKFNFANIYSRIDPSITYGEKLYNDIKSKNDSLIYEISAKGQTSPIDLLREIGKAKSLYALYNPEDSSHIKNRQTSWRINDFTMVNINFLDNDGNEIEYYQNIFDILSMANLYTYYHNIYDYNAFEEYCNKLVVDSYTVNFDISDVYFCSGCMKYEEKEKSSNEYAIKFKELINSENPNSYLNAFPKPKHEHNKIYRYEKIEDLNQEPIGDIDEDDNTDIDNIPNNELINNINNTNNLVSIVPTPNQNDSYKEIYVPNSEINQQTLSEYLDAIKDGTYLYDPKYKCIDLNYCPGHIDLNANVIITGLNNKKSLASLDTIGNDDTNFNENWHGWNLHTIKKANILSNSDWFTDYGINVSKIQLIEPLSIEEINYYIRKLPENISRNRYKIIKTSLESVGKIPYYFGGKPYGPYYSINKFGRIVQRADHKGRILRGLDCSGWVSWVYETAIGKDLNAEGTPHLASTGVGIKRKNLEPGDVAVKVKDGSHVVIFLAWANDGKMYAIHENASANNVSTGEIEAYYPYYRNLLLTQP